MADAEGNGELPSTGDPRVDAALRRLHKRSDARFKDLEDAMIVQSGIEKRQTKLLKEHSERIVEHETWFARHQLVMREIEDKLNALIDLVDRMQREG